MESAFGSSGSPLQIPGRVLVGEGVLIKMCRYFLKDIFALYNIYLFFGLSIR